MDKKFIYIKEGTNTMNIKLIIGKIYNCYCLVRRNINGGHDVMMDVTEIGSYNWVGRFYLDDFEKCFEILVKYREQRIKEILL